MEQITLSRALQVKNRLAEKISSTQKNITENNSRMVFPGAIAEYDVEKLYDIYVELQGRMVDLKDKLSEANRPVQAIIFELAELKGRVQMLKALNTKNGKVISNHYAPIDDEGEYRTIEYSASITNAFVEKEIRTLENEIDTKQSELERHNHQTTIDFNLDWM